MKLKWYAVLSLIAVLIAATMVMSFGKKESAPGFEGITPGQEGLTPGQEQVNPGDLANAPPGIGQTTPGQTGTLPRVVGSVQLEKAVVLENVFLLIPLRTVDRVAMYVQLGIFAALGRAFLKIIPIVDRVPILAIRVSNAIQVLELVKQPRVRGASKEQCVRRMGVFVPKAKAI